MLLAVCAHRTQPKENVPKANGIDTASLKSVYSFQNGVVVGDVDVVEIYLLTQCCLPKQHSQKTL